MAKTKQNFTTRLLTILPLLLIGVVAIFAFLIGTAAAGGITPSEVVNLANRSRVDAGLGELVESPRLSAAARAKAEDMIKNDYFAHTSPQGKTPWSWIKAEGYSYKLAGENLAVNYSDAKEQHQAWMKSSGHRANIMNGNYREIGVAVIEGKIDGERSLVTVELFATPLAAVAKAPASTPTVSEVEPAPAVQGVSVTPPIAETPAIPVATPVEVQAPLVPAYSALPDPKLILVERMTRFVFTLITFSLLLGPVFFLYTAYMKLWGSLLAWARTPGVKKAEEYSGSIKILVRQEA